VVVGLGCRERVGVEDVPVTAHLPSISRQAAATDAKDRTPVESPIAAAVVDIGVRVLVLVVVGAAIAATGGSHPSLGSVVATGAVTIGLAFLNFGQ
jgi:ABC-type proline/glycine betaine transport system permease subunit